MIFNALSKDEEALVESICRTHIYKADEEVIHEGDEGKSLFVVKSGTIEIRKPLSPGQYKKLKDLTKGDFFGDMSFLGVAPRSADVIALEDSEVNELPQEAFDKLAEENPAIGMKIYKCLARELALRLKKNTDELKTAVMWAISGMQV